MTFLEIIKVVLAAGTIVTGLVSLIRPRSVQSFTGLTAPGSRGLAEIRAVLGGGFIGLGAAPLMLGEPAAYSVLGIAYLAIATGRIGGIVFDKSTEQSNLISLAVEIVFGVVLLL